MIATGCSARAIRAPWRADAVGAAGPQPLVSHSKALPIVPLPCCAAFSIAGSSRPPGGKTRSLPCRDRVPFRLIPVVLLARRPAHPLCRRFRQLLHPASQAGNADTSQAPAEVVSIVPGTSDRRLCARCPGCVQVLVRCRWPLEDRPTCSTPRLSRPPKGELLKWSSTSVMRPCATSGARVLFGCLLQAHRQAFA